MIPRNPKNRGRGREYVELPPKEKLKLLNEHGFKIVWDSLNEKKWCLHCDKEFSGLSARIYREDGQLWVECGTANCDGSPIDFADFPWWNPDHPLTQAHDAAMDETQKAPQKKIAPKPKNGKRH